MVGNLPSEFGHARPLDSLIIRDVREGQTDGRTDGQKQRLLSPSLRAGGIIILSLLVYGAGSRSRHSKCMYIFR